ncbi:hypothetical protein G6O67_004879 [Ophiocordyceps sinensis]|uniref:Uncharacterized protein n=2 Tax=Ophiocordyceps sinensis TaxID=72228 RepID=A0A8H4PQF8_9HYPO|nr:hypothetical protein OCS_05010 [Ophiocordyceps sinensis CO18]KAF4508513.1 hypothetical protein G6O67_004879 [Ophiocordyceps sinensis]
MAFSTNLVLLVGTLVAGVMGVSPYTNGASTETAAPQDLGYMTMAGSLVHSVNMCTIVHSTICQTSMSTEGAHSAPSKAASQAGYPSPAPGSSSAKVDAAVSPADKTRASVVRATNTLTRATTMTKGNSSAPSTSTSEDAEITPTPTDDYQPTSGTVSPVPVSTGASNSVSVVRGVAIGAGAMAVAFLF